MSILSSSRTTPADVSDEQAVLQHLIDEVDQGVPQQSSASWQGQEGRDQHVLQATNPLSTAPLYPANINDEDRSVEQSFSPRLDTTSPPPTSNARLQRYDNETAAGVIMKTPNIEPKPSKILCQFGIEIPEEFRSTQELDRHVAQAHELQRKGYICIANSPNNTFLTSCKHCRTQKVYGAIHNAAAHLRRVHFNPYRRGRKTRSNYQRGGIRRGYHTTMGHLIRYWIREVEVKNNVTSLFASASIQAPELMDTSYDFVSAIDTDASYPLENIDDSQHTKSPSVPKSQPSTDIPDEIWDQRSSSASRNYDNQDWVELAPVRHNPEMPSMNRVHGENMEDVVCPTAAHNPALAAEERGPADSHKKQREQQSQVTQEPVREFLVGKVIMKVAFKCPKPGCSNISFERYADFRRHHDQQHASKYSASHLRELQVLPVEEEEFPQSIIGHVRLSGKFSCVGSGCQDIKFDQQKDFHLHYNHVHASNRQECDCDTGEEEKTFLTYSSGATEVARKFWQVEKSSTIPQPPPSSTGHWLYQESFTFPYAQMWGPAAS
ncbi:hypothetical protein IQ06DRAFT_374515 [Phaeosphaeriaceae sp. SRC1lsM3a]|nr:hypothetical protein IQ06DRAFT_374515 [Stagonospora sp. SRC1lsM3a]